MEQDSTMADAPTSSPAPVPEPSSSSSTTAHATNGKPILPKTAAHHGAPTRDWINTHVTGVLLEGMKLLAAERPEAPLHALGVYLLKRSAEIEGKPGAEGMAD